MFLAEKPCSTRLNAAEQVARLVANRSQIQTAMYIWDRPASDIDVPTTSGITGAAPSPIRELLRKFVLGQDVSMPKWIRCMWQNYLEGSQRTMDRPRIDVFRPK